MSILVKEDYVNPETPLWASNGSGGGGGGGTIIQIGDIDVLSLGSLAYTDVVTLTSFSIPAGISPNDDFILDLQIIPEDVAIDPDTGGTYPLFGNLEYVTYFTTTADPGSWGNTSSIFAGIRDASTNRVTSGLSTTVIAFNGDGASPVSILLRNNIPDSILTINSIKIVRITFTKIGTGVVIL